MLSDAPLTRSMCLESHSFEQSSTALVMTDNDMTDSDATMVTTTANTGNKEPLTRNNAPYSFWYKKDFRSFSCSHLVLDHLIALSNPTL